MDCIIKNVTFGDEVGLAKVVDVEEDLDARRVMMMFVLNPKIGYFLKYRNVSQETPNLKFLRYFSIV